MLENNCVTFGAGTYVGHDLKVMLIHIYLKATLIGKKK